MIKNIKSKSKKEDFQKVRSVYTDKILIKEINFKNHYFKTKWGEYFTILRLGSYNVMSASEDELHKKSKQHGTVFKEIRDGLNFFDIYISQYFKEQVKFLESRNQYVSENLNEAIKERINQYSFLSKMNTKMSYVFIFGDTIGEMESRVKKFQDVFYVKSEKVMDVYEYAQIFFKYFNRHLPIDMLSEKDLMKDNVYDVHTFIKAVSPLSKPKFNVKSNPYVKSDIGYEACLQVFQYKIGEVGFQWLSDIANLDDVIVVRSHSTQNVEKSKDAISHQNSENSEQAEKGRRSSDRQSALRDEQHMFYMNELIANGEVVVDSVIRIYIWGKTIEELDGKVSEINSKLIENDKKASLDLFLQERDWIAPFQSLKRQQEYGFFAPVVKEIPSSTLGATLPYDFQNLMDKYGVLLGNTFTGDPFIFDIFFKNTYRKNYHMELIGNMGSGKSSLMKILLEWNIIRGNYSMGFDFDNEYRRITLENGGVYINPFNVQSRINPLQIIAMDDSNNYALYLEWLKGFIKFIQPDLTDAHLSIIQQILHQTYQRFNIHSFVDIGEITNDKFPIFDDVLETYYSIRDDEENMYQLLEEKLKEYQSDFSNFEEKYQYFNQDLLRNLHILDTEDMTDVYMIYEQIGAIRTFLDNRHDLKNKEEFKNIGLVLKSLASGGTYSMFNGYTTFDLKNTKTCFINMQSIKNGGVVFHATYYLWSNVFWSIAVKLRKQKNIDFDKIERFSLFLDEAKTILDPDNHYALKQILEYSSRGRKYYLGMIFGLQAARDVIPESREGYYFDMIKRIFSQIQYHAIFEQKGSNLPLLSQLFTQLTEKQLNTIPSLQLGQSLFLTGEESYFVNIHLSKRQEELFDGGR